MCLENSKQAYAFLKALEEAGVSGLDLQQLTQKMGAISLREFDSRRYISAPVPLMTVLRRHIDSNGVSQFSEHRFKITDVGLRGLKLLNKVAITPERERSLAI
jgi:hypothetical protein